MEKLIIIIIFYLTYIATLGCSVWIGRNYFAMRNGQLRIIMYLTYFSIAWAALVILAWVTIMLPVPLGYLEMLILAGMPLMAVVHWKFFYLKKAEFKSK